MTLATLKKAIKYLLLTISVQSYLKREEKQVVRKYFTWAHCLRKLKQNKINILNENIQLFQQRSK